MSDLSEKIEDDAQKTQSTTVDGVTTTRRSLKDQIEADRYLRDVAAAEAGGVGVVFRQIVPSGGAE